MHVCTYATSICPRPMLSFSAQSCDSSPLCAQLIGEGEPLKIDESSLTGECLAVTRHPGQEVGSSVLICTCARTDTHTHTHVHMNAHGRAHAHTDTLRNKTQAHAHTRAHTHTHTHTHSHTQPIGTHVLIPNAHVSFPPTDPGRCCRGFW
jgi:high-affinity K+ transport system ATPase subunit B